jgi:hypothetical protein
MLARQHVIYDAHGAGLIGVGDCDGAAIWQVAPWGIPSGFIRRMDDPGGPCFLALSRWARRGFLPGRERGEV